MSYTRILLLIFFTALQLKFAAAQVYPVQGNAALIPPYSVYLADYTSRTTDRLVLNIVLNDINRPELQVRLRLKIEGQNAKIETKPEYIGAPITLQGGIPLRLNGTDLIEYFNPQNLNFSGITRREFEKSGALPQGFYQFCFEVVEYNRGVKISNTICAPGWLILNDPPIVNLPRNNEKLKPTLPQNVIFQWTPRHTGSPNSAFSTEYELTMVEVWPATRNPNDAVLTSPPILETTTRSSSFVYGPAETPLELGRRYAFRVRAKSMVGVEEFDLFKNNGFSEVFSFVYGDACQVPMNVSADGKTPSRFTAHWDGQFNHTGFQLRYREAGNANAQWFTANTLVNEIEIASLKPNTTYEYQVAGSCGIFESALTTVATVKTARTPAAAYSCGLPIQTFNLDLASLAASLQVGDIIQAGDFEVQLTRVRGSNGMFSGEGTVIVPFLNSVKVKAVFSDIKVNKENRLVAGYLNVTGAALDIIPDQVTAMMDQLDATLDQIEDALNKAEDAVDKIDDAINAAEQVVNEVAAYLPESILNEIKEAKNEIAAAKTELQAASTPEAKEQAKVELKKAREKMKDAAGRALEHYAKTVGDLLKLLKEVFKQLGTEATATIESLKKEKTEAEKEFTQARGDVLASRDGVAMEGSESAETGVVHALKEGRQTEDLTDLELEELKKDPRIKRFLEQSVNFSRTLLLLAANEKIHELITKGINDDKALQKYVTIVQNKIKDENDTFKQAIKEGKLNSPEIREKVVKIIKESLFQDYLNSEK
ncbi:MAG: fibronectin type III domain-containing protein [Bacteroidota bacterium]